MQTSVREIACPTAAWKLLRGIVCVYKPPEFEPKKVKDLLRENLTKDLNEMDREMKFCRLKENPEWQKVEKIRHAPKFINELLSPKSTLLSSYSNHPAVLGDGKDEFYAVKFPVTVNEISVHDF